MEQATKGSDQELFKDKLLTFLKTFDKPVELYFNKKDGTIRRMLGTLNPKMIHDDYERKTERTKTPNPDVQVIFDTEINEWRSVPWDAITEVRWL